MRIVRLCPSSSQVANSVVEQQHSFPVSQQVNDICCQQGVVEVREPSVPIIHGAASYNVPCFQIEIGHVLDLCVECVRGLPHFERQSLHLLHGYRHICEGREMQNLTGSAASLLSERGIAKVLHGPGEKQ